ncbi:hypothetical protein DFH27DRAFT_88853 [Peziza echinospora]|nr:hypothetical protein DFH27DRAFT_88853 [Peziza echinospora]
MDLFRRMKSRLSTNNLSKQHKKGTSADFNGQGSHNNNNNHHHLFHHGSNQHGDASADSTRRAASQESDYNPSRPSPFSRLPDPILGRIFAYICPHGNDDNYLSSEDSLAGNGCPLCNSRDLAEASRVCRRWRSAAHPLLYKNVRLEQVHYCDLEEELWRRRNRRSFFSNGNTDSNEPVKTRMRLLYRSIQENEAIAKTVEFVKAPFWVREGCKQELTLLVSLLPNLRYVDLPQAVFTADHSCPLLSTMKSRSWNIRVMGWRSGAETSFINSVHDQPWRKLEIISLASMKIDDLQLQSVLHTLPNLHTIKLEQMTYLTDALFDTEQSIGFPLVKTLTIEECPNLTCAGLTRYLTVQRDMGHPTLESLTLTNTGFLPDQLNTLLALAPVLRVLSISAAVSRPCMPVAQIKHLTSSSLEEITYDITNSDSIKGLTLGAPSYYTYLADSLCGGMLPRLRKMHVNEARFAQKLKGTYTANTAHMPASYNGSIYSSSPSSPPPMPMPSPNNNTNGANSNNPFFQVLTPHNSGGAGGALDQKVNVYCKGHAEMTWKLYVWTCTENGSVAGGKAMAVIDMEPEKQGRDWGRG